MSKFETIEFVIEGPIARIGLNRPDMGNALNDRLIRDLAQAAQLCDSTPGVKVVLLTANGRMFCVGGDLNAFAAFGEHAPAKVKELADELHKAVSIFARMAAPLVIAVNGPAAGAGFSLSLIGDYVLAAETATFTLAYTAAGLSPDGSASYYLPRIVGLRRAQELAYTNRMLTAAEAADWGIVTRVVPEEALLAEAEAVCRRLAQGAAGAQAKVKALLLSSFVNDLEAQMDLEAHGIAESSGSPDGQEGVSAFLAKRKPLFR